MTALQNSPTAKALPPRPPSAGLHCAASLLRVVLALLLCLPAGVAQTPQTPLAKPQEQTKPPRDTAQAPVPGSLRIIVLEGNNVVNSIPLGRSVMPVVEVRDENELPVEGATVVFTLPENGPGGTFAGNQNALTARSNSQGQTAAPFLINGLSGKFEIKVTATLGNRMGETVITQTNAAGGQVGKAAVSKPWYKKWYVWAIVGGAAAAGGVTAWALTRGSDTVTITPGGPVFR
jgi:hypothetical protein